MKGIVVTIGKIAFRNEKIIHVKDKLDQLQLTIAASKRTEKVRYSSHNKKDNEINHTYGLQLMF